ncbi:MAG: hypothetical protein AAFQ42_05770 [Pseudomonadota bacterium]
MGSPLAEATWNGAEGAMYTGAGSGMEAVWLGVSIVMCVVALIVGIKHENDAYKRKQAE